MLALFSLLKFTNDPAAYGLPEDFFQPMIRKSLVELLYEFSFSYIKISTPTGKKQIVFEASERKFFREVSLDGSMLAAIAALSCRATFTASYTNGYMARTKTENAWVKSGDFFFSSTAKLQHLECAFYLPEYDGDTENIICDSVLFATKIFSQSRILYNGNDGDNYDLKKERDKNYE